MWCLDGACGIPAACCCVMGRGQTDGRHILKQICRKPVQWETIWLKLHSIQEYTRYFRNVEGKNNTSVVFLQYKTACKWLEEKKKDGQKAAIY